MKSKRKVFIAFIGLLIALLIIALYNGVFTTIKVKEGQEGGYHIAGLEFTGPYSSAGKFMKEVEKKIKNTGISTETGFGIYYDNPKIVKEENCKSFIGVILDKKDLWKIEELKSAGFKVDSVAVTQSVSTEFFIQNFFSYMLALGKHILCYQSI